ncbi:MAG: ethanolamine utilization protein EutN [Opitutales bacterium]|nr:ethanolamine utilization protein EutN [Opitutales bacterium]
MKIGRVIGRVVLSKRDANLPHGFLLAVSPLDREQLAGEGASKISKRQPNLVAFDNLGARQGDLVSYVEGAEATAPFDSPAAIDAYCVGIVDTFKYDKSI